ncbi:hypothetical protein ESZ00_04020 [Silvibacterium dinghuense]|uniref:Uncharacterized protein n=2 Tax=Silvibacterium dinghuense TaxID=1560006 RepID=A0A4Q1SLL0_9BACT|nr:hypothetical protein ESZ00_04020 [Silvibacterium dinghuense]
MIVAGLSAWIVGLLLVRPRLYKASGADRVLLLGPVFEAVALAMFAAEHFFAARDLMGIVPHWLPAPLFWTYFVGIALLAAAISFVAWRQVHLSAPLLALLFLLIVITIDLPNLPQHIPLHLRDRLFWTLTVRETAFACGALVLAGSVLPRESRAGIALVRTGRAIIAAICIFYAVQHFLFPQFVPGVPLEKLTPSWVPWPHVLACLIGASLLFCGVGLLIPRAVRIAAASTGAVLVLLTLFFYVPIFVTEMHTPLALEGMNYVGDTLLFAATVLLAGLGTENPASST